VALETRCGRRWHALDGGGRRLCSVVVEWSAQPAETLEVHLLDAALRGIERAAPALECWIAAGRRVEVEA
jgi:hypothetical protein